MSSANSVYFHCFRQQFATLQRLAQDKDGAITRISSLKMVSNNRNNKCVLFFLIIGKNWRLFIEKHLWLSVLKTKEFLPSGSKEKYII